MLLLPTEHIAWSHKPFSYRGRNEDNKCKAFRKSVQAPLCVGTVEAGRVALHQRAVMLSSTLRVEFAFKRYG